MEYLPEKGKIEVRSNKNITKNITNINKCEHFTRNLEKHRMFAIIEQLQDVDKYE